MNQLQVDTFLSFGGIHKSAIYKTYDDARDFKINIYSNLISLKFNNFFIVN